MDSEQGNRFLLGAHFAPLGFCWTKKKPGREELIKDFSTKEPLPFLLEGTAVQ